MTDEADWVAVDWGTSNLRVWGIGAGGEVAVRAHVRSGHEQARARRLRRAFWAGLLAGDFRASGPPIDVLICGMAGARQGWMEAPYLDAPADLDALVDGAVAPAMPDARFSAAHPAGRLPAGSPAPRTSCGARRRSCSASGRFGPASTASCACRAPIRNGCTAGGAVERFATAMTGELFEVLRTHSVLRHSFAGPLQGPDRERRVPGRARRGHRGAAEAAGRTLQGPRGLPALGPHARLVRRFPLGPADRHRDRRAARLDRRRRGRHCRRCGLADLYVAGLGDDGRQGADHRRDRGDACRPEDREATGLIRGARGKSHDERPSASHRHPAGHHPGRSDRRLRGAGPGRHHDDRGAAQLAPADRVRSAPPRKPSRAGRVSAPARCSSEDEVDAVAEAGGAFVVSPDCNEGVIARTLARGLRSYPGVFSPTEAFRAISAGAHGLKLFPAEVLGAKGIKAMKAVLPPEVPLYAVGGASARELRMSSLPPAAPDSASAATSTSPA